QGDGDAMLAISATTPSISAATDGDDYMEGGGGNDLLFGNDGQDDIIGGSSSLFGLTDPSQRPDGADTAFGGSGTDVARNSLGDTTDGGHARDADVVVGDNGNIYRIVKSAGGGFATFNYDDYAGTTRIIPP